MFDIVRSSGICANLRFKKFEFSKFEVFEVGFDPTLPSAKCKKKTQFYISFFKTNDDFKGPIIYYFFDGRSPSRPKHSFFIKQVP